MSHVILYRSLSDGRVYGVVTDNAHGLREFDTLDDALVHLETGLLPEGTPVQIRETDGL